MTWPNAARFEPDRTECPECGADNTANGDRRCLTNVRMVVDGDLRVVFEARCPCGWEDAIIIGSNGSD